MSVFGQLRDQYGFIAENTPMDELRVAEATRLVGNNFALPSGLTPTTGTTGTDPNFWTGTNLNSATIAQTDNQVLISSGTNAAASSIFQTVRRARYVGSISNRFRAQIMLNNTGVASNTRRWGAFDGLDGAYFELAGTTLSACVMKTNGARTSVAVLANPTTNITSYEIYFTNAKVYFVISGVLVATHTASTTTWAARLTLPCRIDNISTGSTTNCTISVRVMTITRLGKLETNPYYFHGTAAATTVIKYGAGMLHRICVGDMVGGTAISLFDNTAGSGTTISIITPGAKAVQPFVMEYHLPFDTGLTVVSTGTWDYTIIYE